MTVKMCVAKPNAIAGERDWYFFYPLAVAVADVDCNEGDTSCKQ